MLRKVVDVKIDNIDFMDSPEDAILKFLDKNKYITASLAAEKFKFSGTTARSVLKKLTSKKIIIDLGLKLVDGKATHVYTKP